MVKVPAGIRTNFIPMLLVRVFGGEGSAWEGLLGVSSGFGDGGLTRVGSIVFGSGFGGEGLTGFGLLGASSVS